MDVNMTGRLPPFLHRRTSDAVCLLALSLLTATACQDQIAPSDDDRLSDHPAVTQASSHASQVIRDRYIVTFAPAVTQIEDEARRQVAAHGGRLHFIYQHALHG